MIISHLIYDALQNNRKRYLVQIECDTSWQWIEIKEHEWFKLYKATKTLETRTETYLDYTRFSYRVG